jgi:hypothetical protein
VPPVLRLAALSWKRCRAPHPVTVMSRLPLAPEPIALLPGAGLAPSPARFAFRQRLLPFIATYGVSRIIARPGPLAQLGPALRPGGRGSRPVRRRTSVAATEAPGLSSHTATVLRMRPSCLSAGSGTATRSSIRPGPRGSGGRTIRYRRCAARYFASGNSDPRPPQSGPRQVAGETPGSSPGQSESPPGASGRSVSSRALALAGGPGA